MFIRQKPSEEMINEENDLWLSIRLLLEKNI